MTESKLSVKDLAVFDGNPIFKSALPVGQLYFPQIERYEEAFRGIFTRQYYTNHGPLVQTLERRLAEYFGVKHVICVVNATIGLIMAAESLQLKGRVIVPAFTFIASAQALTWAGIEPVFCDIDRGTHQLTPETIDPLLTDGVCAILGVNLWGGSCDPENLQAFANQKRIKLFFDSAHAFGCRINNIPIGRFGAVEVFSFHATKVFSSAEGGCVTTNDDELAKRLRNIRSSYGAGPFTQVVRTSNGRMSEAQAAIALLNLENITEIINRNCQAFDIYKRHLMGIPGLKFVEPVNVSTSNCQYIVVEVDIDAFGLSRDKLLAILKAENIAARRYFYPGVHRSLPYSQDYPQYLNACPNTDWLNRRIFQLPSGAFVSSDDVELLCRLLKFVHENHIEINQRMSS
jgi:dTDP-4-amino-4,6-dideoxygalactose transaminase